MNFSGSLGSWQNNEYVREFFIFYLIRVREVEDAIFFPAVETSKLGGGGVFVWWGIKL